MIKRLLGFLLICLVCLGSFAVQAQTVPFAQILLGEVNNTQCSLTFRVGQAGTVTCLVYAANEKGEQGTLLQVAQWDVEQAGIHTKEIPVTPSSGGYFLHLGGSDVDCPKAIRLDKLFLSSAWRIEGEETTNTLTQKAIHLTGVEIIRNEKTVTPGDVVLPGDIINGFCGEVPYTGYAVVAGDVDLNGSVNAKDALLVLRHAVGKITLADAAFASANFGQNGKIDAAAALNILKFSVGKVKSL